MSRDGIVQLTIVLLWIFAAPKVVNCKRILIIAPIPLYSHQSAFEPLYRALHGRGHELVVAALPINVTLDNYTVIDTSLTKVVLNSTDVTSVRLSFPRWKLEEITWKHLNVMNRITFEHPRLRQLYAEGSNEKFDVVMVESLAGPALCSLAQRFHAPLIGIASTEVFAYLRYLLGDPLLSSHPSNWEFETDTGFNLPFWKRLTNYVERLLYIYRWTYIYIPQQQEIAREYLGANAGDLHDVMKNMSLLLISQSKVYTHVKPAVQNIIYFNGLHIAKKPPSLPKNLKKFLDGATEGFVYVSLGSNVRTKNLPKETLNAFITTFMNLSCKVLWKFEDENLAGKPDNVLISKWTPQQGVLAHPNIKAYVYQGGQQSTEEAIHYAVPLIGLPVVWDQGYVVNRLVERGVAIRLDIVHFSDVELLAAIHEILHNKRYKENMIRLSNLSKDKLVDSVENVVWWIEHVMRHNGTPYLRYNGAEQPFYERYDTDIIAVLAIATFLAVVSIILALITFSYFVIRNRSNLVNLIYKSYMILKNVKEKTN